jgi:hypothetical protein
MTESRHCTHAIYKNRAPGYRRGTLVSPHIVLFPAPLRTAASCRRTTPKTTDDIPTLGQQIYHLSMPQIDALNGSVTKKRMLMVKAAAPWSRAHRFDKARQEQHGQPSQHQLASI